MVFLEQDINVSGPNSYCQLHSTSNTKIMPMYTEAIALIYLVK